MCSYSAAPGGQAGPVALVPGGQAGPVAAGRVAWWWPGRPRCLVCHYIVAPGAPGVCDPVAWSGGRVARLTF
jgi:cytochrome c5